MHQSKYKVIFERFFANNPNPKTELCYRTPFELLIAVILSARATDRSVNKATELLFQKASTPQEFLILGLDGLLSYIKTIGLYRSKAVHIIETCKKILSDYEGVVPRTREELESLPGVGRKTANVLLNTLFNEPTIAVDTHIFRVSNRIGLAKGSTPLHIEKILEKKVPKVFQRSCHHWLVLHGRYVCKARNPDCQNCIIEDLCEYTEKKLSKQ